MEFINLELPEKKLMLKILDVDINSLVCDICKEKTTLEECSIMPSLKTHTSKYEHATILCKSILCMSEYFTKLDFEEDKEKKTIKSN